MDIQSKLVYLLRECYTRQHNYSIIIEGGWEELENLEKWIIQNMDKFQTAKIWYGKTNYDFGFVEYFLKNGDNANELSKVIPLIYTTYPHSNPPGLICKSDGENKRVLYNPEDTAAVVFD